MENLWYKYVAVFIVLIETVVILFCIGIRMLNEYVRKMTTWQVSLGMRLAWKLFVPVIPLVKELNRLIDLINKIDRLRCVQSRG